MDWSEHDERRQFYKDIHRIAKAVEKIAHCVCHPAIRAVSSTLTFKGANNMPINIAPGQSFQAVYQEFDASGNPVAPTGAVTYQSDNLGAATVDPVSGAGVGVGNGSANISANDAGLPAPGLPASDVVNVVVADVAVSATMTLTAGAAPPAAAAKPIAGSGRQAPASKQ